MNAAAVDVDKLLELPRPAPVGLHKILDEDLRPKLARLITHPLAFRELHGTHLLPPRERRRMTPRRPELLRTLAKVMLAIAHRCDLVSARVGIPRRDSFTDEKTGETLRHFNGVGQLWEDADGNEQGLAVEAGVSITQLRRRIALAMALGWLTYTQRVVEYRKPDGTIAHYACRAVYVLTLKFWQTFGLDRKWLKARQAASHRAGERRRIYAAALLSRPVRQAAANADAAENLARRINSLALRLRERHPQWSADRVRLEARRLARE